jgi:CARDB
VTTNSDLSVVARFEAAPDLVVTGLTWAPSTANPGTAVRFSARVKNQGTAATPSGTKHSVQFSVDGVAVTWSDTDFASPLAPGASITLTANNGSTGVSTWAAKAGRHSVAAYADDQNLISEVNGSNNKLTKTMDVYTTLSPASASISAGSLRSGSVTSLKSQDSVYYQVDSTTSSTRTATWSGTVNSVANSTKGLKVALTRKNSVSCTQTIYLYNYTTSAWVALKTATLGTSSVSTTLPPTGTTADYVSGTTGTGSVRLQVKTTNTSAPSTRAPTGWRWATCDAARGLSAFHRLQGVAGG